MGQSSSRHGPSARPTPSSSSARPRDNTLRGEPAPPSREQPDAPREGPAATKRSRRSSLRRSILGLLPGSSSSSSPTPRARKESTSTPDGQQQPSLRKRWRSSRRWSKAPAQLAELAGPAQEPAAIGGDGAPGVSAGSPSSMPEVVPISAPSLSSRTSTPSPVTRSSSPPPETPPEASQEAFADEHCLPPAHDADDWAGDSPSPPAPDAAGAAPASAPSSHPTTEDIAREVDDFLNGHSHNAEHPPEVEPEPAAAPAEQPPSAAETPAQQASSPRHFPPPGTLVVVQGVVNTTDTPQASQSAQAAQNTASTSLRPSTSNSQTSTISRRRSLSTPRSGSRATAADDRHRRHRLSSLIRPTSMLGRSSAEAGPHAPPTSLSVPDFNQTDSRSSREEPAPQNSTHTPSDNDSQAAPTSDGSNGRGLSQGSIDVLGTLLSVAAAATAASLFSPSLSLNNPTNGGASPLAPAARPLSPTPTAGLGALGGLGGLSGLGLNPAVAHSSPGTPQDSRDRIRNMWESIRERVGLNPRNSGTAAGAGAAAAGDDAGGNHRMRPGELMLAEMARALNAGLGLANSAERRTAEQPADAPAGNNMMFAPVWDPTQPPPPDGSFERFLFNLQTDLRTILADDGLTDGLTSMPTGIQPTVATPSSDATASPSHVQSVAPPPELVLSGEPLPGEDDENPGSAEDWDFEEHPEEPRDEDEVEEDDVRSEEDPREPAPRRTPPRTPTPIPPTGGIPFHQGERAARGAGDAVRPAINIWRLYRFDPIPATQTQEQGPSTAPSPVLPASEPASLTPSTPASATPDAPPEAGPSAAAPAPEQPAGNFVVPVIVVGLQSVDVPGHDEHDDDLVGTGAPEPSFGDPQAQAQDTRPRGRTWHSRAANALRTLRPGRRGGSRARAAAEGGGSRTFLIYVIGGYYPPNHHMVTGSDTLDSYEALWELAELLGQVKPPTASKEDIDKSGLQIIRASDLQRLEQEGRVAANCVERCLICLDDYGAEDELRLMSCRHTFHRDCVDRWLTVGRNNCPACRSQGVSVGPDAPASPTTPSS